MLEAVVSSNNIMAVSDAYVFPGFLTPVLTQLFFSKPLTTFLTRFHHSQVRALTGVFTKGMPMKITCFQKVLNGRFLRYLSYPIHKDHNNKTGTNQENPFG